MEPVHGCSQNKSALQIGATQEPVAPDRSLHQSRADAEQIHADVLPSVEENRESSWLLNVVICSGRDLLVGRNVAGDLFCMLHTFDGVSRSKTVSTQCRIAFSRSRTFDVFKQVASAIVYSSANPSWPSNGNGNAFVLPVRRTDRKTILVVTVWDGSESVEEANPVGKVKLLVRHSLYVT
jgi:hypothetical protein